MSNPIGTTQGYAADQAQTVRISAFLQKVYGWMFVGLAITAVVAYAVAGSPTVVRPWRATGFSSGRSSSLRSDSSGT